MSRPNPPDCLTAETAALGPFTEAYVNSRVDAKDSSRTVYGRARRLLVEHFGADRELQTINTGDACAWRLWMIGQKKADSTVRKVCGIARMVFKAAGKRKLIDSNPFDDSEIKTTSTGNDLRFHFVPVNVAQAVIDAAPNAEWRLMIALSRWGGLRWPSQPKSMSANAA